MSSGCVKGCLAVVVFVVGGGIIVGALSAVSTSCENRDKAREQIAQEDKAHQAAQAYKAKMKAIPVTEHLKFIETTLAEAKKQYNPKKHEEALARLEFIPHGTTDYEIANSYLNALGKIKTDLAAKYSAEKLANAVKAMKADKARRKRQGVIIGMTQEEVLLSSWGRPSDINKTISAGGTHEQWVYSGGYLYFENGILTTIQN